MFFHCIIFAKQGQSHRPTGRGAGSRAAPRKSLISLADSGRRILWPGTMAHGPGATAGGRIGADLGTSMPGIGGPGIGGPGNIDAGDRRTWEHRCRGSTRDRPGIDQGSTRDRPGRTVRGPADRPRRARISGQGPWARSRSVRFRAQGAGGPGRDSLKMAPGPQTKKGPARIDPWRAGRECAGALV